jgi:hypothetical protein
MKKLNNKILIIALAVLASILILSRVFRSPGLESTLPKQLVTIDTAQLTQVKIVTSLNDSQEVVLVKEGKQWFALRNKQKVSANADVVKSLLSSLTELKPQRLASRKKDKWESFNVDDKGTSLKVYYGTDKKADMFIGRTSYAQSGAFTYVRVSDEKEVYTIAGTLGYLLNKPLDEWRDKTLLRVNKNEVSKLIFQYPADSSFVIEKRDTAWYVGNRKVQDANVESYLSQLTLKSGNSFADNFTTTSSPTLALQIESKNGTLAMLQAWKADSAQWVLSGSSQKDVYFSANGSSLLTDLFIGKKKVLPE